MSLPNVKISFANGSLGAVGAMDDGVCGLLSHGAAVSTTFALDTPYLITSLEGLERLGVTASATGANGLLWKTVEEFYTEAPRGSKLWLMGVAATVTLSDMVDKTKPHAGKLLAAANGEIRCLMVKSQPAQSATVSGGIANTVLPAALKLQQLAEEWTENKYAPFFGILEGLNYNGTASDLTGLGTYEYNRVAIVIGDTAASSNGAAIGLVGGRVASVPVQRSIARVKDGAIGVETMYIGGVTAENGDPDVVHDAGYICPRTFVGKAGYYWSDDKLATKASDDYHSIANRRVADKAYRIAYQTLVEELSEEVQVNADGTIVAASAKSIEAAVVSAITSLMGANGNLGTDPNDTKDLGVECVVDGAQNVVSTSTLVVDLRVKPFGYAKYINVTVGFMAVA